MAVETVTGSALVKLAGRYWGEIDKSTGNILFSFLEISRTDTEVNLLDGSRNVGLRVNLPDLTIYYGDRPGLIKEPLYKIANGYGVSRIQGSNVKWDTVRAPGDNGQ